MNDETLAVLQQQLLAVFGLTVKDDVFELDLHMKANTLPELSIICLRKNEFGEPLVIDGDVQYYQATFMLIPQNNRTVLIRSKDFNREYIVIGERKVINERDDTLGGT